MTLIEEIIAGATGTAPVASLLRQLKVLAARTGGTRLGDWVESELGGYAPDRELPSYRGPFEILALGTFLGPFSSQLRNIQIPPSTFPAEYHDTHLFKASVRNSVAEVEEMSHSDHVQFAWPPDAVRYYNYGVEQGIVQRIVRGDMVCAEVVHPVPSHVFIGILDTVRSKALDLALELESTVPMAGQADAPPQVRESAAHIINNHFYAPSNLAIDGQDITQVVSLPAVGDVPALAYYVESLGIPLTRIDKLKLDADDDERSGSAAAGQWDRVRSWFADAITDVGTGTIAGGLAAGIAAFLGTH